MKGQGEDCEKEKESMYEKKKATLEIHDRDEKGVEKREERRKSDGAERHHVEVKMTTRVRKGSFSY